MVICYPSSVNPLLIYYGNEDLKKYPYEHNEKGWRKILCGGFGGTYLIVRSSEISKRDELTYLVNLWNDVPEVVSSEVLCRMSDLATQLDIKFKVSIKS